MPVASAARPQRFATLHKRLLQFGLPFSIMVLAAAADTDAAHRVFDARLPTFRTAAPDEVLDWLRQRVTTLLAPLPHFDPGSQMVDDVIEQPWPALRHRCVASGGSLSADDALALADGMLREGRIGQAQPDDRGTLAAMLAALDGRVCRCANRPSLALAADCAS